MVASAEGLSFRRRSARVARAGGAAFVIAAFVIAAFGLAACGASKQPPAPGTVARVSSSVTVSPATFHGWDSMVVRNGTMEVVVVPAIGRVMQLALLDGGQAHRGPLWNHPRLGAGLAPDDNGWINFGGDKAWPSPQSRWTEIAGKGWPPPQTFDAMPYAPSVIGQTVELLSAVDPGYGLRVRRRIALDPGRPIMTIETRYEKVRGAPVRVGVWTIAQLGSPDRLFVLLPERSAFEQGHVTRLPVAPRDLKVEGRLLSLARDPAEKTMIGSDGDALLWVGDGPDLLIERVAPPAGEPGDWPEGAHAQIYTSSDDAEKYVELELFGRVRELRIGDSATMTARYTLSARRESDPLAEAKRVLLAR
jgi:hypothetical protein